MVMLFQHQIKNIMYSKILNYFESNGCVKHSKVNGLPQSLALNTFATREIKYILFLRLKKKILYEMHFCFSL